MSEPVKQEGDFKIKKKTPRKFSNEPSAPAKIDLSQPKEADVTKVVIDQPAEETTEPAAAVQEVVEEIPQETTTAQIENTVLQEITEEEVQQETKKVEAEIKEAVRDERVSGKPLPENVEKLVLFMEETGGTVQDYVRLNADYTTINDTALLKEYYSKTKPYLEGDDVNILLEDFSYDEELDDEKDIRKRKIAFKEEVGKAKHYLEGLKSKYYDEIKLRPGVTQEQQKATDFFNRYNKQQEAAEQQHAQFQESTKELFNNNFEGFDIKVGDKNYKYNIQNRDKVAENQSNINNLVGKFLDADGNVKDTKGYHKAMYAADNVDKIAAHFYEQGKADAVKEVVNNSKNLSSTKARATQGDVFLNGFKVKAISGADSTKLKIKTKKFN